MSTETAFDLRQEVDTYLTKVAEAFQVQPREPVARLVELLIQAYENGRTLYTMGNGGHGSTASHLVNDMSKHLFVTDDRRDFVVTGRRFRAVSLNDSWATMTAWANDMGYEMAFAGPLSNLVEPGDIVLGITGSGNSANLLRAFDVARQAGATSVALTGPSGGKAKAVVDLCLMVPSDNILHIEDVHMGIAHLCTEVVRMYVQRQAK